MEKVNRILNTTAAQIALELGYSKHAIIYCYEPNIRAGELVMKILDVEESGMEIPFIDEEKMKLEEETKRLETLRLEKKMKLEEETKRLETLRLETLNLWKRLRCHVCWLRQAEMLALPCAHIFTCQSCVSHKCIICDSTVSNWIRVHT